MKRSTVVSIHTLHELEASIRRQTSCHIPLWFPFIRFTNWKQDNYLHRNNCTLSLFPFIRFTNWKQALDSIQGDCYKKEFPFIRFTNWKQEEKLSEGQKNKSLPKDLVSIHTLHELEASVDIGPSRIRHLSVSIHTLHELEARRYTPNGDTCVDRAFPFIRFTNWKQERV